MKQRLHYFDMLKGIAIFMVVMGHVITMCIREIDRTALFKIVGAVHMPLFFFISGWMSWRGGKAPALGRRALQLLPPMLVCSTLWIFFFPHSGIESPLDSSFGGLWMSDYKNGYWFTLVLFEVIAVYAVVRPLACRCRGIVSEAAVYAAVSLLIMAADYVFGASDAGRLCSWTLTADFFPVFAFGVMASRHADAFRRLTRNSASVTVSMLVCALTLYAVCWPWDLPLVSTFRPVMAICVIAMHVSLAIVAVAIVGPWSSDAFAPGVCGHGLARMWAYIGTQSLAVYLLHYFFLFPMGWARGLLEASGLGFVPALVLSAAAASFIVAAVLLVNRILQPSPFLSWLLAGHLPKFKKDISKISANNE